MFASEGIKGIRGRQTSDSLQLPVAIVTSMQLRISRTRQHRPPPCRANRARVLCCEVFVENGSPYTFSVKPKWRTVVFWFFAARSSAESYLRKSPPRGHPTVGAPMRCEGFVAIWLRAREDIAANRFQLLFINID